MALTRSLPPLWKTLLPTANTLDGSVRPVVNWSLLQRLSQPFLTLPTPFAALAIPSLAIPSLPSLGDIWDGILKAVPKKQTSYRKRRQRFLAGKALPNITALNTCSSCGRVKRMHLLCPYCVDAIKTNIFQDVWWSIRKPTKKQDKQLKRELRAHNKDERMNDPVPNEKKPILGHGEWKKR